MTEIQQASIEYVDLLELPVIPLCSHNHINMSYSHRQKCSSPGKCPDIWKWQTKMHTTVEEVKEWFEKNPFYNIGLVLGQTAHYNLVGIDVDGEEGEEILKEWSKGDIPPTWEFTTGSGRRLLYLLPQGLKTKKAKQQGAENRKHQELALLCSGQQTVLPPSIHHTGRRYTWVKGRTPFDIEIAPAPQWIIDKVKVTDDYQMDLTSYVATVEEEDWTEETLDGGRNDKLVKLVGSYIKRNMGSIPKEEVIRYFIDYDKRYFIPPVGEAVVRTTVESIWERETMSRAKTKTAQDDKAIFEPLPFVDKFITQQKNKGILWKYIQQKDLFYSYDMHDPVWRVEPENVVQKAIMELMVSENSEYIKTTFIVEIYKMMKLVLLEKSEQDIFDLGTHGDIDHVYVSNGILDWNTLKLKPWYPECNSTIKLPVVWDEQAQKFKAYTYWQECLDSWIPDKQTQLFLQEFVGYTLIPDCKFRQALFLTGAGKNGKSLFIDVVKLLHKEHVSVLSLDRLKKQFGLVNIMDKLLNVCQDIDGTYIKHTGLIKSLIAGETVQAEIKYGSSFPITPVARLIFSANELPRTSDKTEGWYSRWNIVEFPNQFKENRNYYHTTIKTMGSTEGLSALLFWAIEGLQRLMTNGEFTKSAPMMKAHADYKASNDNVAAFVFNCTEEADTNVPVSDVYIYYKLWCEAMEEKPVTKNLFSRRLNSLGIETGRNRIKKKAVRTVRNIRLVNDENIDVDLLKEHTMYVNIRSTQ